MDLSSLAGRSQGVKAAKSLVMLLVVEAWRWKKHIRKYQKGLYILYLTVAPHFWSREYEKALE